MHELPQFLLRVVLVTAGIVALALLLGGGQRRVHARWPVDEASAPVARAPTTAMPAIAAEADALRAQLNAAELNDTLRRNTAHPRTLATYRGLRAYPGAPPRVPHGLTDAEFRETQCRSCHERGGYTMRFRAYVPVTPHPQLTDCLQCHLASDELIGMPLPSRAPDALCRQCHVPGMIGEPRVTLEWRTAQWPATRSTTRGVPPVIPHELETRSACLTCHSGPGAVAEIRTTHAQQLNCRQCHLPQGDAQAVYQRGSAQ